MASDSALADGGNRAAITVCVILATLMQALDTTIANVALPYMQGSVSASQDEIDWVLTSYIVAAAIMTPPTGFLASRFGIKRLFLVSVAGFTIVSMLCGAAQSLTQIVVFRVLQGAFGAALVPLSQTVLLGAYPRERQGFAMALFGVGVMVGPVFGPVLGGWLTENYSWRYVFYINLPIGIIALLGMMVFLPDSQRNAGQKLDWFGFGTLSLAVGALQLMLDRGEIKDWFSSGEIVIEAIVMASALYLFLVHTFTADKPFVRPALFRDRNFTTGTLFMAVVGLTLYASMALQPPFLQELMDYPVSSAGIVMGPRGIGTMISMLVVGRLVGRIDTRLLLGCRSCGHRVVVLRDDRLDAGRVAGDDCRCRIHSGRRARLPVRAAEHRDAGHAIAAAPHRRRRLLQSLAQHRLEYRHFDRQRAVDAQHPDQSRRHRCARHRCQPRVRRPDDRAFLESADRHRARRA